MYALELKNIQASLSGQQILRDISLQIEPGEIVCLLGPSGGGKTTLLRSIAGFQVLDEGEVWITGDKYSAPQFMIPVEKRELGMVFQDFALFPHLNVRDNISFGIEKLTKQERVQRFDELTELLAMEDFIDHYPHQLSGGQQQRVAIARAMAPSPSILLMDEPFSSMDVELREQLARELRLILKQTGVTAIMVSHNQQEAFAMADRVGIIEQGRLLQLDSAFNLYHKPATGFVADFIGEGVFLLGTVIDDHEVDTDLGRLEGTTKHTYELGQKVRVLIRPDDILHDDDSSMTAIVKDKVFRGAEFLYTLSLDNGDTVLSLVPSHHDHAIDEAIGIRLDVDHLVIFPVK